MKKVNNDTIFIITPSLRKRPAEHLNNHNCWGRYPQSPAIPASIRGIADIFWQTSEHRITNVEMAKKFRNDGVVGAKYFIAFLILLSFTTKGFSQYTGGSGDGFAMGQNMPVAYGIKQVEIGSGVRLSPNPVIAGQNVNLQFAQALNANATLTILDITGRVIKNETITANSQQHPINTSGMQPGTYIIRVVSEEYQTERKLTIL